MKRLLSFFAFIVLSIIIVNISYYYRWKTMWSLEEPKEVYHITHRQDDTLRIAMIGDSWVGMRTDAQNDTFRVRLSEKINSPVIVKTKGKGGEKSRGIYQLMFLEDGFGTRPLLSEGVDYCVVIAGINDAASNLGKKQYVHHMRLMLDFLLANDIRPILIEVPNVNIWNVYGGKPYKDLIVDYIRSFMTGSGMYHYSEYREALLSMLVDKKILESVLYIPMKEWNGYGEDINKHLFLNDQIHLNQQGYIKVDSCIIEAISQDL